MSGWPRTLHARLTVGYAVAFFAGLIVFAALSFASLDAALKTVVDARLISAEAALNAILERDREFDHDTRGKIELILGSNLNGAVFADDGRAVFSNIDSLETSTRAFVMRAEASPRLTTLTIGGSSARIVVERIRTASGATVFAGLWRQLDLVQELERLAMIIFGIAVVVIAGSAIVVGSIVAKQGLSPLRTVASLASEIEASDLSRRLAVRADDSELGSLAMTFDRMLARLEAAFERQRRFTADASHELRAPLSVIQIAAEVALRRDREPAAYRTVLHSILASTQQLAELTDRLLEAARADAGQLQFTPVNLSAAVGEAVAQVRPLGERKGVSLETDVPESAFVQGDHAALRRAVVALLVNAIKTSKAGQKVTAAIEHSASSIRVSVRDTGPGFSPEGLTNATQRFWRDDRARGPGGGTGLGLAICDSIVRSCGGTLTLENVADGGANVVLAFPARLSDVRDEPVI